MSQPFFLRTLGRPALIAPDGSPVRFRVKKHLALLIYLAVEPRTPQRREYLADLLWPSAPAGEGRHSLATAVSILRGMFGPGAVESTRDTIRLAFGGLTTDLERLEAGDVLGGELEPPLDIGDLLQDLELSDAPGFCHWKDRLRAHWRPMIQAALLALLDRARRDGDWRQLDQLADRLFELEELSEQGMRAKMEAVALAGDRVAALKLYGHWSTRLQEELSAVPSPLLQRFAEHLRRGGLAGGGARPLTVPAGVAGPFVGRAAEYRALYEVWESTLERRPRHAIVRGESGVGKTTLVARLLAAAALEGTAVARVRCYELEQEIPYAGLTALLGVLLDRAGAAATPPECLADLALILPAVRQRFQALPPAVEAQGEGARLRFSEAAFQLISAVAEEQPVVLAVDDLHLADDVSVAVLHHVLRRLEGQRVMMVFAGRTGDVTQSPNAARLIESAARLGIRILDVEPLDQEASDEALGLLLTPGGIRPGTAARRALVRAARGYPMVLALLARDWDAHRSASIALSLEAMTRDPAGQGSGTAMAQDAYALLLDRVLQRLDSGTRPVLDLAAVLGSRMNELRFYGLLGLSSAQTMGALGVLGDHHVMRSGGPGIEFVNDLVRAHLYLRIPAPFRRQLHHLVADELLQRSDEAGTVGGLELAWHLMRCGRVAEAVECLLRGAREAIDHGAAWEAERALVTGEPELVGATLLQGRLLLVEALAEQGRDSELREVLSSTDLSSDRAFAEAGLAFEMGALRRLPHHAPEDLAAAIDTALTLLQNARLPRARAVAARAASQLTGKLVDGATAVRLLHALGSVDLTDFPLIDRAELLYARAYTLYQLRRLDESDEQARTAVGLLEGAGVTNATLQNLYAGLGALRAVQGRYSEALPLFTRAEAIARQIGNATAIRSWCCNLAICHLRLGNFDEQVRFAEQALGRDINSSSTYQDPHFAYYLALGHALRGDSTKAFDAISMGDSAARTISIPWIKQSWLLNKADVLWLLSRGAEARAAAREAVGGEFRGLLNDRQAGPYSRWLARLDSPGDNHNSEAIEELVSRLDDFDLMDQAEILAAKVYLQSRRGQDIDEWRAQLERMLQRLPKGAEKLLESLGVLESPRHHASSRRNSQRTRSAARRSEDHLLQHGSDRSRRH